MVNLITGGLGFLGTHLARKLINRGEEVVLFDILSASKSIEDIRDQVKIVRGDLANWAQVLETVKKYSIDTIYHMGALLSASSEADPLAAYNINANGTFHVLEAARLFDVKTVIFFSSVGTYGDGVPDRVDDNSLQWPTTMYGVTKVLGERLGEYYHIKFGVNFRGVRFPSIIGPGRGGGGASAFSSQIIEEPALGRPYVAFVDEETKIPLLYLDDAVQSMVSIKMAPEAKLKRRMYNIEGFSPTAKQLATLVKKYIPEAQVSFAPVPEMVRILRSGPRELDGSQARQDWGWQTRYSLDEAVKHFIQELRKQKT
jgi:threonine 3-dehydrogenase